VCASCDLKLLSPNGLYGCGYCILRLSLSLGRLYNLDFNPLFIVSHSPSSSLWQSFETMKALSLVRIARRYHSSFSVMFVVLGLAMFAWSTISIKVDFDGVL
jgi:hypothetical protein